MLDKMMFDLLSDEQKKALGDVVYEEICSQMETMSLSHMIREYFLEQIEEKVENFIIKFNQKIEKDIDKALSETLKNMLDTDRFKELMRANIEEYIEDYNSIESFMESDEAYNVVHTYFIQVLKEKLLKE